MIYNDKKSVHGTDLLDELYSLDDTVSIHHQNIQQVGIEMF